MIESNKPIVSIITTFFNEEKYLDRCLTSISKQTYQNLEVILINDGSSDSSLTIAEKYCKDFTKYKLITIKNSGHAEARNIGVAEATGIYLTFLDADDALEPRMIETYVSTMVQENVDLIDGNYTHYNENYTILGERKWPAVFADIHTTKELIPELYKGNLQPVVWAKMFKADLAKEIKFDKGLWFDDWPFTLEYLHKANSVAFVEESLFSVYGRPNSITRRTLEPKRISDTYRIQELTALIHKRYGNYLVFKKTSFKMVLNTYIDNFIIFIIDEKLILNKWLILESFRENLSKLRLHIKNENIRASLKEQISMKLLSPFNEPTYHIFKLFFVFFKKNRLNKIKKIKQIT